MILNIFCLFAKTSYFSILFKSVHPYFMEHLKNICLNVSVNNSSICGISAMASVEFLFSGKLRFPHCFLCRVFGIACWAILDLCAERFCIISWIFWILKYMRFKVLFTSTGSVVLQTQWYFLLSLPAAFILPRFF